MKYKYIMFLLIVLPSLAQAELYQWRDSEGTLHFSDKRPEFVSGVNTIETAEPKTVPIKSLSKNSLVERAKNLPKRQLPSVKTQQPKRHKSQITIIKDDIETNAVSSSGVNVDFKKVTGFDNPDQLDIARIKCNSIENSDCRTKTLMHLKLQEIRGVTKARSQAQPNRAVGKTLRLGGGLLKSE